jgi:hypothetical protein
MVVDAYPPAVQIRTNVLEWKAIFNTDEFLNRI